MKPYHKHAIMLCSMALLLVVMISGLYSQEIPLDEEEFKPVSFKEHNLGGPRLGLTYAPNLQTYSELARKKEIGEVISQFGWHFEYQVVPKSGGPSFVIEFVPLLGGVEYGIIIPSFSLLLGIRLPMGIEFGMGPNALITGGEDVLKTALVIGVGYSIRYGDVSLPLNLAFVKGPDGNRFSFIFGYAIPTG